jgi:hypothetical protein
MHTPHLLYFNRWVACIGTFSHQTGWTRHEHNRKVCRTSRRPIIITKNNPQTYDDPDQNQSYSPTNPQSNHSSLIRLVPEDPTSVVAKRRNSHPIMSATRQNSRPATRVLVATASAFLSYPLLPHLSALLCFMPQRRMNPNKP